VLPLDILTGLDHQSNQFICLFLRTLFGQKARKAFVVQLDALTLI